jgi:hypothetical protein
MSLIPFAPFILQLDPMLGNRSLSFGPLRTLSNRKGIVW